MKVGTYVEWDSSGGTARGKIVQIVRNGEVPDIDAKIVGSDEEPAARIQVFREDSDGNYEPSDTYVGHKITELRQIKSLAEAEELNDRQNFLVSSYITAVEYMGMFNKGSGADGAHYMTAEKNPFASEGLACKNCVFFAEDSGSCSIVSGPIEENAICKLWVIEEYELTGSPDQDMETEDYVEEYSAAAKYGNINFSPPDGVKSAARRGLELHEKGLSGGGLEPATVAWARKYVSGDPVSPERARMGNRFFGRNARFAKAPKDSPAWVSWLLWGGSSGRAWFSSLVRQMDSADKKKSSASQMRGFIRMAEESTHPLMKEVELILTDFEPNANKEGIPESEANNIIKTAKNTPIKIAVSESGYGGHTGAIPIGPITEVYMDTYENRPVIKAKAMIWTDEFKDVYTLLKSEAGERDYVGTSWEVYYRDADVVDGVSWLKDVTFAGTCVVDTPAYGNRTKLLKVAEKQMEKKLAELENALADKEALIVELQEKVKEYEREAQERALAEKKHSIVSALVKAGLTETEASSSVEAYMILPEESFKLILSQLEKRQSQASKKDNEFPTIPNPTGSTEPMNPREVARAIKNKLKSVN